MISESSESPLLTHKRLKQIVTNIFFSSPLMYLFIY